MTKTVEPDFQARVLRQVDYFRFNPYGFSGRGRPTGASL
jgi:hypothetical protein